MLLGLWVAIGALVASAPGVQAEEGRALHVTDDTARHLRYTSRAKREADVSLSHRCTMEHPVAPWSTTMRRVFHPETNGVNASPHRLKWMLTHGAPADPSDPWNSHAAPVSPRQNGQIDARDQRPPSSHKGATARRRLRVLGVTCNAGDVRCPPRRVTLLAFLRLCARGACQDSHICGRDFRGPGQRQNSSGP